MEENPIFSIIKAISKDNDFSDFVVIEEGEIANNFFSWNQDLIGENRIFLPKDEFGFELSITDFRGVGDIIALYFLFHDKEIHQRFLSKVFDKKLFDEFEKVRLILNIPEQFQGVSKNILNKIAEDFAHNFSIDFSLQNFLPLLLLSNLFLQFGWENIVKNLQEFAQSFDKKLLQDVDELMQFAGRQELFAAKVLQIIDRLYKEQNQQHEIAESSMQDIDFGNENQGGKDEILPEEIENKSSELEPKEPESAQQNLTSEEKKSVLATQSETIEVPSNFALEDKIEFKNPYKIFSSKFDEIITAKKMLSKEEMVILRQKLEIGFGEVKPISKKITNKLKKKLLAKKITAFDESRNEAILNRKRLVKIVLNPLEEDIWIDQKEYDYQDVVVTILLDNSGSMRGKPIVMSALACETIVNILQEFNIKSEILGFTTADWRGGKSRKLWEASGKVENSGRLNDLRHIIYKAENENFRKAKNNLGLVLKEGILKENIDGEALLWAKSRLAQSQAQRKILMVISDGAPIDDATNANNEENILIDHLHHVIAKIEKQSKIELVGIGIGHDVGRFYKNSIVIKDSADLGDAMIEKLVDLF